MKTTLRGRPRLNIELPQILEAVWRHGQVMAAARELGCSDAYIHVKFKQAGLTLADLLNAARVEDLLHQCCPSCAPSACGCILTLLGHLG